MDKSMEKFINFLMTYEGLYILLIIIIVLMLCLGSPNICYFLHKRNIKAIQDRRNKNDNGNT